MPFSNACRSSRPLLAGGLLAAALAAQSKPAGSKPGGKAPQTTSRPMAPDRPVDKKSLFAAFAKMQGLEATFVEEKKLALLALPLKSSGKLYFMRPGYLARVVEKPDRAVVTITPDELRVSGPRGEEVIDLRKNADVRVFVHSLVRVFSGDAAALEKAYKITFAHLPARPARPAQAGAPGTSAGKAKAKPAKPTPPRWSLQLVPRQKPLTQMMKSLSLQGSGYAVDRIEVLELNGDRAVTRILEAHPQRKFSAKEKARLFGIRPR